MPRTHAIQRLPARATRKEEATSLATSRPFGQAGIRAPGADAARLGHDFARVAVRRDETGLGDRLKAGIERLSGVPLDDVRVHYRSTRPARVQAAAFTQGTHIHVAPGQEHHLAHEAWHVVQQKQGRVRATGRVAGLPLNDAAHLEREASVMGAKALAAGPTLSPAPAAPMRRDAGAGAGAASAPVQAWPEWLDRLRGKKPDPYATLSDPHRALAHFTDEAHFQERADDEEATRRRRSFDLPAVNATASDTTAEKVKSYSEKGATALSKGAEAFTHFNTATQQASQLGAAAPGLSVASSLVSAASGAHTIATGDERAQDKGLLGGQVLSDLGSATTTAASGASQGAKLGWGFAKAAAPALSTVAGPAAIARGGVDIVRGTAQAGLAGYRRGKLQGIEEEGGREAGVARFAKQTQTTRVASGIGTAVGGGLALAGGLGIAGLALSNPVGWGLLGGAALVGGGIAVAKKVRKHQLGKQLDSDEYRGQLEQSGIHVPTDRELEPTSTWGSVKNFLTGSTSSQRRYEAVRGHIAQKLAKNEDADYYNYQPGLAKVLGHMGIKPKPEDESASESSALLDRGARARRKEAQEKRAKNIARALEG